VSAQKALKEALEAEEAGSANAKHRKGKAARSVTQDAGEVSLAAGSAGSGLGHFGPLGSARRSLQGRPPEPEPDPDRLSALSEPWSGVRGFFHSRRAPFLVEGFEPWSRARSSKAAPQSSSRPQGRSWKRPANEEGALFASLLLSLLCAFSLCFGSLSTVAEASSVSPCNRFFSESRSGSSWPLVRPWPQRTGL